MGIGNILLMDEGVGPEVSKRLLSRFSFPPDVEVRDCATMGFELLSEFRDFDRIITVDAVDGTGLEPGTVVTYEPDDIAMRDAPPSAHDIRFSDVILAARMLGYRAEGHCVGVQVENMSPSDFHIGLTSKVEAAVPLAMETVIAMLLNLGVEGIVDKETGDSVSADDG